MPSCGVSDSRACLIFFAISLFLLVQHGTEAAPTYASEFCGDDNRKNATEFAANSTYQSNLNLLLSSISSNATRNSGFTNFTVGGQNGYDAVYGLSLCRGDVTANICQDCIATACRDIARICGRVRYAIIWYDECMLQYSNLSLFSIMSEGPRSIFTSDRIVSEVSRFMQLLAGIMNDVAARAAKDRTPPEKFATEEKNFTRNQSLHTLAQCTPDLNSMDCDRCLRTGIAQLPENGSQGAQVLMPSCRVRYELFPFYNQTGAGAAPPPPPIIHPPPPLDSITNSGEKSKNSSTTIIAIVVPLAFCGVILFISCCYFMRSRAKKKDQSTIAETVGNEITTVESLQFDFGTIKAATNNFSDNNKIGEGGFGAVYKGILPNGLEVAVKRLSRSSGQGEEEFENEVVVVAKLQHRNLVRLIGFCLEGEERILVYEFVPNKSLDCFLFDPEKRGQLDWSRRYKIIRGVARGMLYLHEDSHLRIIHRDLKAGNVLLDGDMNPKVSDFGMAKIVGQATGNTSRIIGTYGYMSPEYVMHGHFSVKSDVFSFGVLLLETVSAKKNNSFYQPDGVQDLLSYAWKLWKDGKTMELMDPTLSDTYSGTEVHRCINIGLLCVQEDVARRPTMATVVLMLGSYSVTLPAPQHPAFYINSRTGSSFPMKKLNLDESTSESMPWSINEVSITELDPR